MTRLGGGGDGWGLGFSAINNLYAQDEPDYSLYLNVVKLAR